MATSCAGWIEPLNLQCLFINTFAGSLEIFIFLVFIFIGGLGAYFRMANLTVLLMFAVFAMVMSQYFGSLLVLVILIAGLIAAFGVSRIAKQ